MAKLGKDDPLSLEHRDFQHTIQGVVIGIVTDNVCRTQGSAFDKDYRVRVKFPWLPPDPETGADIDSYWARIATIGAGPERGMFWLPEKDDEVLVTFINGEFNQPVIIGSLWNGMDKPTYSNKDAQGKVRWAKFEGKNEAKKNDLRSFTSRTFHQLIFNDNASSPRVALHSSQKHRIVLDDDGNEPNKIEIYDGKEENYILIDTKNKKITMETKTGDILIKAKKTIRFECETLETKSDKGTQMDVGQNFDLKVKSNMTMKANGQGDVESSGTMTIKGSTVNIN
ncbi:MAG TPA: phage baseplate assembly protein V [Polyangia bacterium]|jgi:uncharacterized protein involved in type VI secretion and phage assembly|nr:phage baseplate assembly protein V [Polyangia bacterium]